MERIEEKPMVVIIASYNNTNWYFRNLASVVNQDYQNYRVIYIDDCSPDGTARYVDQFIKNYKVENRFRVIKNKTRKRAMRNFYETIHQLTEDDEIIVVLDGDDWFYDSQVLRKINEAYSSPDVWATHGTLMEWPGEVVGWSKAIPSDIVTRNEFRQFRCPSHTRTFYSWLFKKIDKEDLYYNGDFCEVTCDMAQMFPIFEMAGERHAFIEEITYVYNTKTPLSDNKVNKDLQNEIDRYLRNLPRYKRLSSKHSQVEKDPPLPSLDVL